MAARDRDTIEALVELNTGRSDKDTLMHSLCDTALKLAAMRHPWKDATSIPDDFAITEDATSIDISATTNIIHIITARIVEADGAKNTKFWLKNRQWWDSHVINPEDNPKGWPVNGMRVGTSIILDRPALSGLELRLRVTTVPTFAAGSTVCPIALLDVFVEQYVTAFVFQSIENNTAYYFWKREALGPEWSTGKVGGSLLAAIDADTYEPAEEVVMGREITHGRGISVMNLLTGHERYGEVDVYR